MQSVDLEELEDDAVRPYKALTLDVELYQQYLDAPDVSEDQKRQFLEAMWSIMVGFVDLGFEVRAEESCGQNPPTVAVRELAANAMIESTSGSRPQTFNAAADAPNDQREREET